MASPALAAPPVPRVLVSAPEAGRSGLVETLRGAGLAVLVVPAGALLEQVESGVVDLVLLRTGSEAALQQLALLRSCSDVPVVVALREPEPRPEVFLDAGADDCLASGTARLEVAARVKAVLRRRHRSGSEELRAGRFALDPARRVFRLDGRPVHLPPKEFGLLDLLLRRDGRVVSREEALELVWGPAHGGDPTTVDVHVKRLRAKVETDPSHPEHLLTVRGLGYRLQA